MSVQGPVTIAMVYDNHLPKPHSIKPLCIFYDSAGHASDIGSVFGLDGYTLHGKGGVFHDFPSHWPGQFPALFSQIDYLLIIFLC